MSSRQIERKADLREKMGMIRTKSERIAYIKRELARERMAKPRTGWWVR